MTTKTREKLPPGIGIPPGESVCHMTFQGDDVALCGSTASHHADDPHPAFYTGGKACPRCGNAWCARCMKIWDLWMEHRIWEGWGDPPRD